MNSVIIGIPTKAPWAFIFERIDNTPRHPVQLYEALSYFIIFAIILKLYKVPYYKYKHGFFFGLSLTMIFSVRFFIEFVKERHAGFEKYMTFDMGQILSIPFIITGIVFMVYAHQKNILFDSSMTLKSNNIDLLLIFVMVIKKFWLIQDWILLLI